MIYYPKFTWCQNTVKPVTDRATSLVANRILERYQVGEIDRPTLRRNRLAEIGNPTGGEDYVERPWLTSQDRPLSKDQPPRVPRFPIFVPGLV